MTTKKSLLLVSVASCLVLCVIVLGALMRLPWEGIAVLFTLTLMMILAEARKDRRGETI